MFCLCELLQKMHVKQATFSWIPLIVFIVKTTIKGSYATGCNVTLYTGSSWDGTSYGPYSEGKYCDEAPCSYNDLINSLTIVSQSGYICNVTIFAAAWLKQDWDRYYAQNGETRYINYATTPDAYYDNITTSYRVWGSSYSEFSSMIINSVVFESDSPSAIPSTMPIHVPTGDVFVLCLFLFFILCTLCVHLCTFFGFFLFLLCGFLLLQITPFLL